MTTIEETIDLFEKKAKNEKERAFNDAVFWNKDTEYAQYCRELSSEYLQLAEWLKELKAHREAWNKLHEEITEYKNRGFFGVGVEDLETGKQTALDWVLGAMENLTPNGGI